MSLKLPWLKQLLRQNLTARSSLSLFSSLAFAAHPRSSVDSGLTHPASHSIWTSRQHPWSPQWGTSNCSYSSWAVILRLPPQAVGTTLVPQASSAEKESQPSHNLWQRRHDRNSTSTISQVSFSPVLSSHMILQVQKGYQHSYLLYTLTQA